MLTKEDTASLLVIDRPNSSESSGKASDDEPKGRTEKSNARTRFTTREFRGHIDTDATWLNATTVKCKALRKVFAQQKQHIATLDALDIEQCYIVAECYTKQTAAAQERT